MVEEPRKEWQLRMEIAAAPRAGAVVATLHRAVVRRGEFTLGPVDLQVDWADRVAITGANGSGKSTLLGALLGRIPLTSGTRGARARASWSARSTRPAALFLGDGPLLRRVLRRRAGPAAGRRPHAAGQVRAEVATTCCARAATPVARRADPGGARAAAGRAGSTCSSWTSRRTTWTCPRSSSWSRRWTSYPGTLLLVTHDRRMLEAVRTNRHIDVHAGKVSVR